MPSDMPWFKFDPKSWLAGDIQDASLELQGFFVDVCARYWKGGCSLALTRLKRGFSQAEGWLKELSELGVLAYDAKSGQVSIKFLDEQMVAMVAKRKALSDAGKRGVEARKARLKGGLREAKARLKPGTSNKSKSKSKSLDSEELFSEDQVGASKEDTQPPKDFTRLEQARFNGMHVTREDLKIAEAWLETADMDMVKRAISRIQGRRETPYFNKVQDEVGKCTPKRAPRVQL